MDEHCKEKLLSLLAAIPEPDWDQRDTFDRGHRSGWFEMKVAIERALIQQHQEQKVPDG